VGATGGAASLGGSAPMLVGQGASATESRPFTRKGGFTRGGPSCGGSSGGEGVEGCGGELGQTVPRIRVTGEDHKEGVPPEQVVDISLFDTTIVTDVKYTTS